MASIIKDACGFVGTRAVTIALGLAKTIIVARWLGPELNGLLASITVVPNIFMAIGSLGIRQAVTLLTAKASHSISTLNESITQLWYITSAISVLSCYGLIWFLTKNPPSSSLTFLAILPIPFSLFATYLSGIYLGQGNYKKFNRITWIPPAVTLLATALFVIYVSGGATGVLAATALGPIVMFALLIGQCSLKILRFGKPHFRVALQLLRYGSIYAIALLLMQLNYKIDVVLLSTLTNLRETGIYTKGAYITEYLWQIPMMVSALVFSKSARTKDSAAFSLKIMSLAKTVVVGISLLSLLLAYFASPIVVLLFGQEYQQSSLILVALLPGVIALTLFKIMNMDLAGRGKPWVSIYAMFPALIINVVLNCLWIPPYGSWGAAVASTVSYSVGALLFYLLYCRETGLPISSILRISIHDFRVVLTRNAKSTISVG